MIKIALSGDVMLGRLVDKYILSNPKIPPKYVWGDTLPLFNQADLRLINLECVIAQSGQRWTLTPKVFHFRANPKATACLKVAKIDFVSLANNHILDYGEEALAECLKHLDSCGIKRAGAGRNLEEATTPAFITIKNLRIGIISLTDNEPFWEAGKEKPGVNYIDYNHKGLRKPYDTRISKVIKKAKKKTDLLIVSAHIGANWGKPSREMIALSHQLIDMGVDLYWGHSNHTVQGIEIYKKGLILYSCGDFIDDYAVDPIERNDLSFLFMLEINKKRISKLKLYPVRIDNFQVNRAKDNDVQWLINWIRQHCQTFNTTLKRLEGTLSVQYL